jgi:hypothetical protein
MAEKLEFAPDFWRKRAAEARRLAELIGELDPRLLLRCARRAFPRERVRSVATAGRCPGSRAQAGSVMILGFSGSDVEFL